MAQRVPSKRSRAANDAIQERAFERQTQGFPPKQAIAIALRQWNDGELLILETKDTTPLLKEAKNKLDVMKTLGALVSFSKARQKQIEKQRSKTQSRSERLKQYGDEE